MKAISRALLVLAPLIIAGIAPVRADELPCVIEGDHVVVDAIVDGKAGRFVLDTGSGSVVLDGSFAAGLDLALAATPVQALGAGQTPVDIRIGHAREIKLGHSTLAGATVSVLPPGTMAKGGRKIDGTLGYDVFARWTVIIDFAHLKVVLLDPDKYRAPLGAVVWPAKLGGRIPIVEAEFVAAPGTAPVKARLAVDTGTARFPVLLSPDFAARLGLDRDPGRVEIGIGFGAAGPSVGFGAHLPNLTVGALSMTDVAVGVPSETTGFFRSGVAEGTLGQGVMRRGVLTVDYARSRLLFEPGANFEQPFDLEEYCGWLTARDADGDWALLFVGRGSPAEAAGLMKGDKLLSLAGHPAANLVRDDMIAACRAPGPLDLDVRSGDRAHRATMLRRKLI